MIARYGTLPGFIAAPSQAPQYSPLMPGGAALETAATGSLDALFMLAPTGTIERRYSMAQGLRALAPGAAFTIAAPRDKGGMRLKKELEQMGCNPAEESRQHYRVCTGIRPAHPLLDAALTDGAPRLDTQLTLWTQPGIFSWDRIDTGSGLMLEHLPPLKGTGLDLGCGLGILTRAALGSPEVQHMTLVDLDRRAVAMAEKNTDSARCAYHWADATTMPLPTVDFVLMNPPFHEGGEEDRSLGQRFIRRAAEALRPGGACWLVANRHLPYETLLNTCFTHVTLHAKTNLFKLYEATK